jgi:hypothetical protein
MTSKIKLYYLFIKYNKSLQIRNYIFMMYLLYIYYIFTNFFKIAAALIINILYVATIFEFGRLQLP